MTKWVSQLPSCDNAINLAITLWVFTESDFLTFFIPNVSFGVLGAMSGGLTKSNDDDNWAKLASRIPAVLLFNWMNLLIFDLANQRHPESVQEDLLTSRGDLYQPEELHRNKPQS